MWDFPWFPKHKENDTKEEKFKEMLKKCLPKVLGELINDGRINIVKVNLIEDKKTNLVIKIKPPWNRPIKKDK